MELFVLMSFAGTLILLTAHVVDYAVEVLRGPAVPARISLSVYDALAYKVHVQAELMDEYDQAA